jgi:hypothetical protein
VQLDHEIPSARTGTTVLSSLLAIPAITSQFAWPCGAVHLNKQGGIASPGEDNLRKSQMVTCSRYVWGEIHASALSEMDHGEEGGELVGGEERERKISRTHYGTKTPPVRQPTNPCAGL